MVDESDSLRMHSIEVTPPWTFSGALNPNLDDPLPGQMKKQLVLKIISGQQLPKPKDSMLGDRGEVEQTRPLSFTPHSGIEEL